MLYDGLGQDLANLDVVVRRTVERLRRHKDKYDFIVTQGLSGTLVGAPASLRLHKPLVVVRKISDMHSSHDSRLVVNIRNVDGGRWLFLDDFISLGKTRQRVAVALAEWNGGAEYCGILRKGGVSHEYTEAGRYLYQVDSLSWGPYLGGSA